jgi:hypothetical protein
MDELRLEELQEEFRYSYRQLVRELIEGGEARVPSSGRKPKRWKCRSGTSRGALVLVRNSAKPSMSSSPVSRRVRLPFPAFTVKTRRARVVDEGIVVLAAIMSGRW